MPGVQTGLRRGLLRITNSGKAQARHQSSVSPSISVAKLLATPAAEDEKQIFGFVRSIRKQKTRAFASIGDGTSLEPLQALLTPAQAQSLTTGSAVRLTGQWTASPNTKVQSCELQVKDVALLGASDSATFPLQKKYQTAEYLRGMPHLRSRLPFNSLLLRLRSQSIAHLTEFFAEQEFVQTHPPIITSSDCEGAGEVFSVETQPLSGERHKSLASDDDGSFFRAPKYLTVSSQLHLEALAQSVGKVWTLSPTFRAERSDTSRHLSEFYMLEAEVGFVDELSSIMNLTEDMLRHMVSKIYNSKVGQEIIHGNRTGAHAADIEAAKLSEELEARWQGMMSGPWPRITYTEAIDILQQSGQSFEHEPIWGEGLQSEHERFIAANIGHGGPVFVTKYPKDIKPFYMLPSAKQSASGLTVECFDLLVPDFCEVAGGSMREYRLPELLTAMRSHGLINKDLAENLTESTLTEEALGSMKWYVDLRTWGTIPHGGFGLGFDRMLGYLSGVSNIREVVAFPRWVGRCEC